MTYDDIIRMAKEADVWVAGQEPYQTQLNRFAQAAYAAGAVAEREECAKLVEQIQTVNTGVGRQLERATKKDCAAAIRARGEVK